MTLSDNSAIAGMQGTGTAVAAPSAVLNGGPKSQCPIARPRNVSLDRRRPRMNSVPLKPLWKWM
jgi:hypothetical protein